MVEKSSLVITICQGPVVSIPLINKQPLYASPNQASYIGETGTKPKHATDRTQTRVEEW